MNTPNLSRTGVACLLLSFVMAASGCLAVAAAGAAGAGVWWYRGELRATVDATPQQVVTAAVAALEDMDITVLSHESSSIDGEVTARTAQDRRVTIRVKRETDASSELGIRVGRMGDEARSRYILDNIKQRL